MPIYEFRCKACGATTEELMRLSDPDPVVCPACSLPELARMLSAPSFRLGGTGWYETDFKGDRDRKRNLAGDAATKPEGATAEAAKPATTSDSAASSASAAPVKTEAPKSDA